ncbi:MAG: tRNA guanosine(34) transglycosylase Tgt [Planctomycetota bacterium]|nr:tRNA guanosine(34) transglycosylase Tgt [Planctomycetota bacterium]MCX8040658.1 tRNA guanosine(34) transglycosylase Tgt [Planctomycetota bacterium]MDW8372801.1 tRNA guanosine(34) transglycosylase Tgt [Planctomycetota bacterium]
MTAPLRWQCTARDGAARAGLLVTPHGAVPTPSFMAVATLGGLKGVTMEQAAALGQRIILANTYHLALRPGAERVRRLGGLHAFCGWDGPMLTDSGGYQVFSLAAHRVIDDEGVTFRSHLDGTLLRLTPEESIRIQRCLGADIIMAFDECPPAAAARVVVEQACARTARWLERSRAAWLAAEGPGGCATQALFAIVQGGTDPGLRAESARAAVALDLPGYAIGGLAVGESADERQTVLDAVVPLLPEDRPRYLMGVGTPLDLVEAVARGLDLFDCVLPTRMGRHGIAYTDDGPLRLKRAEYAEDPRPIDDTPSPARRLSRGYLHHLLKAGEVLGGTLLSLHNLAYYQRLMARLRAAIRGRRCAAFAAQFRARYRELGDAAVAAGAEPAESGE